MRWFNRSEIKRVIRFATVGIIATATHISGVLLLVEQIGRKPLTANIFAFSIALMVSFSGNHHWTFNSTNRYRESFPRFSVIALLGLALNQAIIFGIVNVMGLDYRLGLAAVIMVVPALSFTANKFWTFQSVNND